MRPFGVLPPPMHEMSIAQSIMSIIQDEMGKHGLTKVNRVVLKNGRLAGVVSDALSFAWEVLTKNSPLDGAELVVEEIPLQLACGGCGHEFICEDAISHLMPCPLCGEQLGHKVLSGKEMYIDSIDAD